MEENQKQVIKRFENFINDFITNFMESEFKIELRKKPKHVECDEKENFGAIITEGWVFKGSEREAGVFILIADAEFKNLLELHCNGEHIIFRKNEEK